MSGTGLVVLAAALVATAGAAWWLRTRNGALRPVPGSAPATGTARTGSEEDLLSPQTVLAGLGVRAEEADLTVVQFSTAFCGPCRATRARLQQLQTTRPGLAYVHVDAESNLDAVRALGVQRTPTLFYVDRAGAVVGRADGAPPLPELAAAVDALTGGRAGVPG